LANPFRDKAEKTPSGKRIRKPVKPLQVKDPKAGQAPSGKGSKAGQAPSGKGSESLANPFRDKAEKTPSGKRILKLDKHLQVKDPKAGKTSSGEGSESWASPLR
jgi:hypothetical protein